jgi:hypothetical protein
MSKKAKEYTRLPGKKKGFVGGYNTLWLGKDHVLSIASKFFFEDYKRFYYGDIQSIITRETAYGKILTILLALLGGLFVLLAALIAGTGLVIFGILAGVTLLLLLINWLRGPTCLCHLYTAVQKEKLPSLNRLRTAQKAISLLRPLIEQAQGTLAPEASRAGASGRPPAEVAASVMESTVRAKIRAHGGFHGILFCVLLLDGLITAMDLFYNHIAITLSGSIMSMGAGALVIIALVKQHNTDMRGILRGITWGALGYLCFSFLVGYSLYMTTSMKHPEIVYNQLEVIKVISSLSLLDSSWLTGIYVFSIVCSSGIGISGLVLLRIFRRENLSSSGTSTTSHGEKAPPG